MNSRAHVRGSANRLVLALVLALLLLGSCRSKDNGNSRPEVRARRFVLVDADGAERGEFSVTSDGSASLVIRDESHATAIRVGVDPEGIPSLAIVDSQGSPHAELVMFGGKPRLALCSPPGKPRAGIVVSPRTGPSIDLLDDAGKPRASLDVNSLILFAPDGSPIWHAP